MNVSGVQVTLSINIICKPPESSVYIRIQLNPDPAKNLNPDPEDLDSGSKLFLNSIWKNLNYFIIIRFSHQRSQLKDRMF